MLLSSLELSWRYPFAGLRILSWIIITSADPKQIRRRHWTDALDIKETGRVEEKNGSKKMEKGIAYQKVEKGKKVIKT